MNLLHDHFIGLHFLTGWNHQRRFQTQFRLKQCTQWHGVDSRIFDGQCVGFIDTTPVPAPLPSNYRLDTPNNEPVDLLTIHITDIIAIIDRSE